MGAAWQPKGWDWVTNRQSLERRGPRSYDPTELSQRF